MDDVADKIVRKYHEQERLLRTIQEDPEYVSDEEAMNRIAALGGMLAGLEFALLAMGYDTVFLFF